MSCRYSFCVIKLLKKKLDQSQQTGSKEQRAESLKQRAASREQGAGNNISIPFQEGWLEIIEIT